MRPPLELFHGEKKSAQAPLVPGGGDKLESFDCLEGWGESENPFHPSVCHATVWMEEEDQEEHGPIHFNLTPAERRRKSGRRKRGCGTVENSGIARRKIRHGPFFYLPTYGIKSYKVELRRSGGIANQPHW